MAQFQFKSLSFGISSVGILWWRQRNYFSTLPTKKRWSESGFGFFLSNGRIGNKSPPDVFFEKKLFLLLGRNCVGPSEDGSDTDWLETASCSQTNILTVGCLKPYLLKRKPNHNPMWQHFSYASFLAMIPFWALLWWVALREERCGNIDIVVELSHCC